MGFQKVETFPFQNIPMNLLANKTQVTPLRAPGLGGGGGDGWRGANPNSSRTSRRS